MTPCRHFGVCGGCSLQDLSPEDYSAAKRQGVVDALARAGLDAAIVEQPVQVPTHSRRRAVFKMEKSGGVVAVGFHAARSHAIVDMRECLVLTPALLALAGGLRAAFAAILHDGETCEIHATQTETGFDLSLRWSRKAIPALTTALAQALSALPVARLLFNGQTVLENTAPRVLLDGVAVMPPPQAFLQATAEGEAQLQARVCALARGAKSILDLFAGLGTFTLPLARIAKVHAVEQDGAALTALAQAARGAKSLKPITTEKRDLFKSPLAGPELKSYDTVVLDPPRVGAAAQVRALCQPPARIARVIYVSCDAASFARDAKVLHDTGFTMGPVTPIDQFLFSGHIELVAGFHRRP